MPDSAQGRRDSERLGRRECLLGGYPFFHVFFFKFHFVSRVVARARMCACARTAVRARDGGRLSSLGPAGPCLRTRTDPRARRPCAAASRHTEPAPGSAARRFGAAARAPPDVSFISPGLMRAAGDGAAGRAVSTATDPSPLVTSVIRVSSESLPPSWWTVRRCLAARAI